MQITINGFAVELIAETDAPSFLTRFLSKRGEGFHHISIDVDALDPVVHRGFPPELRGRYAARGSIRHTLEFRKSIDEEPTLVLVLCSYSRENCLDLHVDIPVPSSEIPEPPKYREFPHSAAALDCCHR